MAESRLVSPSPVPGKVRAEDGTLVSPPEGWELLPPGDAGLTRRVKAAGPSWTVQERVGRRMFSRGVWAPAETIQRQRDALRLQRGTAEYARKRAADLKRRERKQADYEEDFTAAVRAFLRFSSVFAEQGEQLARAVAAHATPVGSGTVARTERIPVAERAEAAVIAWLRHQTTAYDNMQIARVKGMRRSVRRQLAAASRDLLDRHRRARSHAVEGCPLCKALARLPRPDGEE